MKCLWCVVDSEKHKISQESTRPCTDTPTLWISFLVSSISFRRPISRMEGYRLAKLSKFSLVSWGEKFNILYIEYLFNCAHFREEMQQEVNHDFHFIFRWNSFCYWHTVRDEQAWTFYRWSRHKDMGSIGNIIGHHRSFDEVCSSSSNQEHLYQREGNFQCNVSSAPIGPKYIAHAQNQYHFGFAHPM